MASLSLIEMFTLVVQCLNVKQDIMFFLTSILKAALRMHLEATAIRNFASKAVN
jgi:hypothetical protein